MEAIKKVKNSVDESLEKVRKKPWAEPLGKAMSITGELVSEYGNFIPGAGIIGGALSFGSSMLNPEPTMEELKKQKDEVNEGLERISEENVTIRGIIENSMRQEIQKLEDKISNPCSEIRSDFDSIKSEMLLMKNEVKQNNHFIAREVAQIKDVTSKTFNLVTDIRYKVNVRTYLQCFIQNIRTATP